MTTGTIRELEQKLFDAFPAEDAISGDRIGLLVGNEKAEVTGIALALDAKVITIEAASAAGCNVLLTHHPVYWYPPTQILKEGPSEGASIYRAAELGVSLITMHTNLDCAPMAREMLLEPAGFTYTAPLALPSESDSELSAWSKTLVFSSDDGPLDKPIPALGQLGEPKDKTAMPLGKVVTNYKRAFGAVAKVWGDPNKPLHRLATCSGAGGSLVQRVINTGVDCFVTGEVAYHEALALAAADVALIELGHDLSELPYRFCLQEFLLIAGYDKSKIHILGPTASWWQ